MYSQVGCVLLKGKGVVFFNWDKGIWQLREVLFFYLSLFLVGFGFWVWVCLVWKVGQVVVVGMWIFVDVLDDRGVVVVVYYAVVRVFVVVVVV